GIIVQGVGAALSAVVLGVESTRVERAFGRTVIPQFHAAYSAGAVGGSVVGAACSLWAVSVAVQFSVAAAVVTVVRLAALRAGLVLPAQPGEVGRAPNAAGRPRTTDWLDRRTLLIAVVAFATVLSEGAANNWLSVAVVDGFGQAESAGGIVLGVFIGGITLARALGSKLIDRFGRVCILRFSLVLAIAGLLAFGLVPTVELGVVAAAAWGLGTGLGFPISVGAASDHQPHAAPRVSLMLAVTMAAGMAAPPLLGFAAGALGVRHALLLVVALLGLGLLAAGQVAPLDPGGKLDRPGSGTGGPSLEPGAEAQVGSSGTTGRG
ncbi:MAG: MFS transporter, partial [Gammaproteobacteria bacterium]|nr:MFS transporter [Gammaproteobacteria bacterium]